MTGDDQQQGLYPMGYRPCCFLTRVCRILTKWEWEKLEKNKKLA